MIKNSHRRAKTDRVVKILITTTEEKTHMKTEIGIVTIQTNNRIKIIPTEITRKIIIRDVSKAIHNSNVQIKQIKGNPTNNTKTQVFKIKNKVKNHNMKLMQ